MIRTPKVALLLALLVLAGVVAGCGADRSPLAEQRAEELVAAAEAAGVADNVTVENAEALYGTSATAVCDVFSDDGELNVPGNPAGRHWQLVTSDAAEYTRLVVKTYCPDRLPQFEAVVEELEISGSTR